MSQDAQDIDDFSEDDRRGIEEEIDEKAVVDSGSGGSSNKDAGSGRVTRARSFDAMSVLMRKQKGQWSHIPRRRQRQFYGPDHEPKNAFCECTGCESRRSDARSRYSVLMF